MNQVFEADLNGKIRRFIEQVDDFRVCMTSLLENYDVII
ncbi:MAG: hypothetical protein ACJAUG_002265 [Halioglobus sp.]|jgi:hypothetical protein